MPEAQPSSELDSSRSLTALGLSNKDGQLRWPLPLRVLASPATPERLLREQIDALVQLAAYQGAHGTANAALLRELGEAVNEFRNRVFRDRPERIVFGRAAWAESERFLDKLDRARELLQGGLNRGAGETALSTDGSMPEVGVHDNYFQPATRTVSVGAMVQWISDGQHRHTVAADDGSWSSQEMNSGAVYQHTFTQPGTYTYHCTKHPREMRGTIIVK
jgi:plastocyanin